MVSDNFLKECPYGNEVIFGAHLSLDAAITLTHLL